MIHRTTTCAKSKTRGDLPLVATDRNPTARQPEVLRARLSARFDELSSSGPIGLRLTGIERASLGTISGPDVCGCGERIAGVLSQCTAELESSNATQGRMGLFAMESEDAFALFQQVATGEELLGTYTAWGSQVVARAAQALAGVSGRTHPGAASLEEDSVISILVGTHAPSDTVVVTLRLELTLPSGEASRPGFVYLLVDPKLLGAALAESVDLAERIA